MRFCMLTTFYPPYSFGGDATYVRALARSLVARGHEVRVIACRDAYDLVRKETGPPPAAPEVPGDDGVDVHWIESRWGALSPLVTQQSGRPGLKAAALERLLAEPFDVLHFHNISLIGGPALLSLGHARVRLYTLHEHWLVCATHIFWKNNDRACDRRTCIRCCLRSGIPPQAWRYTGLRDHHLDRIDLLLAPSEFTAEIHRADGIGRPIHVLPLFSAIEAPAEPPAEPSAEPTSRRGLVFAGRVTASKGVEHLLRVVAAMPRVELRIVGDGDLLPALRRDYAGHPRIRFLGRIAQPDLVAEYRHATALVLPSLAPETFGLTVVEAAACGTPAIVASGSGGAAEIVRTSGGGIVYDGEAGLAAAVDRLTADPAHANRLGAAAQAAWRRRYTQETHVDHYLGIVDRMMASAQGSC